VDCGNTFSNSTNGCNVNGTAVGSGHVFKVVTVGDESKVHCGDTGVGSSGGHEFSELEVGENVTIHCGNFDSLDTKERVFGT
jgi:hypothetical protein